MAFMPSCTQLLQYEVPDSAAAMKTVLPCIEVSAGLILRPRHHLTHHVHGPGNVSVSKVVGSVWSFDRQLLCSPFEALCSLDGNALAPTYNCQVLWLL